MMPRGGSANANQAQRALRSRATQRKSHPSYLAAPFACTRFLNAGFLNEGAAPPFFSFSEAGGPVGTSFSLSAIWTRNPRSALAGKNRGRGPRTCPPAHDVGGVSSKLYFKGEGGVEHPTLDIRRADDSLPKAESSFNV